MNTVCQKLLHYFFIFEIFLGIPDPDISWSWPSVMSDVMMTSILNPSYTTRVYTSPNNVLHIDEV